MVNAFVDAAPKTEGSAADSDSLPTVLPVSMNLRAPFNPSSDSPWLTITGVTNGVASYSFTENLGLTRTAHINLLGQLVPIIQSGPAFTLGMTNLFEPANAGSDSVILGVSPNLGIWTATNNVSWLHVSPANANGTGSAVVVFNFDSNPGGPRSGTLTIAGQMVTVTQAGSTYVAANPASVLASTGLSLPSGVAVDGAGNVFIADAANHAVKEWIATNNAVITVILMGLNHPAGLALDGVGNVYIADSANNALYEWMAASNVLTTLISSGLNNPSGGGWPWTSREMSMSPTAATTQSRSGWPPATRSRSWCRRD